MTIDYTEYLRTILVPMWAQYKVDDLENCPHPGPRLFSWFGMNADTGKADILCVACCECGEVLQGADGDEVKPLAHTSRGRKRGI